jgi:hypothetical protein
MPRWSRLVPPVLVYSLAMIVALWIMHSWISLTEEPDPLAMMGMLLTLLALSVSGAVVVYRSFVRSSLRQAKR